MSDRPRLPSLPADDEADPDAAGCWAFLEHIFRLHNPHRVRVRRMLNAACHYREGRQNIEPIDSSDEGEFAADFQPTQQRDDVTRLPMVSQNEQFARITREAALLQKVGSRPYVRADSDDPRVEEGARMGKDVLLSELDRIGWNDRDREGSMHQATYGTRFHVAYTDIDYTKTKKSPSDQALRCPNEDCDVVFARPDLPEAEALDILKVSPDAVQMDLRATSTNPNVEDVRDYKITHCPRCSTHRDVIEQPLMDEYDLPVVGPDGEVVTADVEADVPGAPELVDFVPPVGEFEDEEENVDFIGRPMGIDIPEPNVLIETLSPHDVFPEPSRNGIDTNPTDWEEFAWQTPKSLAWIRRHFPENGWKVQADDAGTMARMHPIVSGFGPGLNISSPDTYEEHAMLRCFLAKPQMARASNENDPEAPSKADHGRLLIMANRVILQNDHYDYPSRVTPGARVPHYHVDWAAWELRDRHAFGLGMSELSASQQDIINVSLMQEIDAQHRGGSPKWLAKDGTDFHMKGGAGQGYYSDYLFYRGVDDRDDPPTQIKGMSVTEAIPALRELQIQAIDRIMMSREVEGGGPPGGGITAYSALLLMATKAAESRVPRNERVRDMKGRTYSFVLRTIQERYVDERLYRMSTRNDQSTIRSFKGIQLMNQTDVRFEDEPLIEVSVQRREAIESARQAGALDMTKPTVRRRVLRYLEVPADTDEDVNQQIDWAEKEFVFLADDGVIPQIDQHGDDPIIHWQQHKEDLNRREWRERKRICNWSQVLKALWDWERGFQELMAAEAEFRINPPMEPPAELFMVDPESYKGQMKVYAGQLQVQQKIAALPKVLEERVRAVWNELLAASTYQPPEEPEAKEAFDRLIIAESHAHAHRLLAQADAAKAKAGLQQPAAPGAPQTPGGMKPGPGAASSAAPAGGGQVPPPAAVAA